MDNDTDNLIPGVDYEEGSCMLCGRSDDHDVNECLRHEFDDENYRAPRMAAVSRPGMGDRA